MLMLAEKRKTFMFEPNPYLNNINVERCKLNGFTNYEIHPLCISDQIGEQTFYFSTEHSMSSLEEDFAIIRGISKKENIMKTTLDNFFDENKLKIMYPFIKIDVEGHEAEVIRGGLQLLASCKPKIIMECEQRHLQESTMQQVFDLLLQLNYSGFFWDGEKRLPLINFSTDQYQSIGEGRFWEAPGYVNNFFFE
jgi:FkbM family methyltransferase